MRLPDSTKLKVINFSHDFYQNLHPGQNATLTEKSTQWVFRNIIYEPWSCDAINPANELAIWQDNSYHAHLTLYCVE